VIQRFVGWLSETSSAVPTLPDPSMHRSELMQCMRSACFNLRQAARAVTQLYHEVLRPIILVRRGARIGIQGWHWTNMSGRATGMAADAVRPLPAAGPNLKSGSAANRPGKFLGLTREQGKRVDFLPSRHPSEIQSR
jgi:hypothetical protein